MRPHLQNNYNKDNKNNNTSNDNQDDKHHNDNNDSNDKNNYIENFTKSIENHVRHSASCEGVLSSLESLC